MESAFWIWVLDFGCFDVIDTGVLDVMETI